MGSTKICDFAITVIQTDEDVIGVGEASGSASWSGETQEGMLAAINKVLAPALIGQDPFQVSTLADRMDELLWANPFAKAALEMALMDVIGKSLGVPVYTLLGGRRELLEIPLKFSIGAYEPAEAARRAELFASRDFQAVKVKVGLEVRSDIARVQAVRSAVGDKFRLAVDANGGWVEQEARAAIPQLERLGVNALEQPLPRWNIRGCARLRKCTSIPIILDESIFTRENATEAIRYEACDVISIYPGKNGGLWRSLEIAQVARSAGLECVIGSNLEGDIGSSAMLHVAASIPNLAAFVDHEIIGPLYHSRSFAVDPLKIERGRVVVPRGPGLGVELDFEQLQTS
ncbi:MAG: mandelate racemase/muconate lactonizing enzyme family protein [Terriglobia bacterium]